jgi:hypothetical protein
MMLIAQVAAVYLVATAVEFPPVFRSVKTLFTTGFVFLNSGFTILCPGDQLK